MVAIKCTQAREREQVSSMLATAALARYTFLTTELGISPGPENELDNLMNRIRVLPRRVGRDWKTNATLEYCTICHHYGVEREVNRSFRASTEGFVHF